jgi:GNAT superfamily N-acetyltransferase
MIKIVSKKVRIEFGLKEIEENFSINFLKRKDIYKCGAWVVSFAKTPDFRHYYIWNIALRNHMQGLLDESRFDEARDAVREYINDRAASHKAQVLINHLEKTRFSHLKEKRELTLLGIFSMAGFIELEPVKPGWAAQHVYFAFLRKDLRGKGLGKMLYDAALVAGGEILAAGDLQSSDARRLWLSIIRNPDYICWVDNDDGEARIVEALDSDELVELDEKESKDENKLIHAPYKVWFPDRKKQDPLNVVMYAIAKKPKAGKFVMKKQRKSR